jgi:hypothetical protein
MNIHYTSLMMLYFIPIIIMLCINSYKDIKDILTRISDGDYLVIIEKCTASILTIGTALVFYLY